MARTSRTGAHDGTPVPVPAALSDAVKQIHHLAGALKAPRIAAAAARLGD